MTANRRSWNDATRSEHVYEGADTAGEVQMAAVPSTIGRSERRAPVVTRDRLRLVTRADETFGHRIDDRRAAVRRRALARRRLTTLAAVGGLVGLWFGTGALASTQNVAAKPALTVAAGSVYVVRVGDSVASIAKAVAPRRDVSIVVRELERELHDRSLRPGMVLRVP
ncbi:MAG: LysM peptidoglycan-binding domain-containing protein [Acidimicrobiales bacterium]